MENLFKRAQKNDVSILSNEKVDKIIDSNGRTPLHHLSFKGVKAILKHPSVAKVKDNWGRTPLHYLTLKYSKEVLKHPCIDQVKDKWGRTPLHELARRRTLTKKELEERFPFIKSIEGEHIESMVRRIANTPQSVRFIMED